MARTLSLPLHLPIDEVERRYRAAQDPVSRRHWQIVWLLARGDLTATVADVTSYSVNWVREFSPRYREDGPCGLGDRRHTNPGAAPLLSVAQQEELGTALDGPVPDGGLASISATRSVSRVLPTPPGPVSVMRRTSSRRSSAVTCLISCSRPMKEDSGVGRDAVGRTRSGSGTGAIGCDALGSAGVESATARVLRLDQ